MTRAVNASSRRRQDNDQGSETMHCRLTGAIIALLLAMPTAAQAQEKAKDKLRYGQIAGSVKSVSSLALYTAQRKGFLARANIELDVIPLPGVHHMIEGLDRNAVDVSHTATPYLIEGVLKVSGTAAIARPRRLATRTYLKAKLAVWHEVSGLPPVAGDTEELAHTQVPL